VHQLVYIKLCISRCRFQRT